MVNQTDNEYRKFVQNKTSKKLKKKTVPNNSKIK